MITLNSNYSNDDGNCDNDNNKNDKSNGYSNDSEITFKQKSCGQQSKSVDPLANKLSVLFRDGIAKVNSYEKTEENDLTSQK